jgi:hypothetical protein
MAPRQAAVMPLPNDETTPPVMKMNRVMVRLNQCGDGQKAWPIERRTSESRRDYKLSGLRLR